MNYPFNDFIRLLTPTDAVNIFLHAIGLSCCTPADVIGAEARSDAAKGTIQIGEPY